MTRRVLGMTERKVSLKACGLGAAKRKRRPWRPRTLKGGIGHPWRVVPPDFLLKLGAKPGDALLVPEADLMPFAAGARVLRRTSRQGRVRGVVFRARRREDLARDIGRYRRVMEEDGFLWVVIPKKTAREALERGLTFEDVLDLALRTDLVDNKTLTFSDTEYGVRLVVRKHLRRTVPERSP